MDDRSRRPGEIALAPGAIEQCDADRVVFIGRIRSPWQVRGEAPRNLRQARERGMKPATVEIDPPFRPGLEGVEGLSHVILLYWMHQARRDLVVQHPAHAKVPRGVFSLRSPVRPNPIGLGVAALLEVDQAAGRLLVDAIDCLDGTPLVDIKPYLPSIDAFPDATRNDR